MTAPTSRAQSGWKHGSPPDRAWKGRPGRTRAAIVAEQDRAAGGRHRRSVDLGEGRFARASVELKVLPDTRRIRAYLRWSDGGKSPARYLGQVEHEARTANLAEGWKMAWERGLLAEESPSEGSWASSPSVRAVMRANRSRDTRPELRLRSLLHKQGLRYRVAARPLPELRRTADLIFSRSKVAVFVDGCFWHGCPEHLRESHKNVEFWRSKIEGNKARDAETDRLLQEAGWTVIRVWEHEVSDVAAERVISVVRASSAERHDSGQPVSHRKR